MLVIGLTGGIGVGKSTVSNYLINLGYKVIDADKISHEITEKGSPVLDEIKNYFGEEIILKDGSLDRKRLAQIVFNDAEQKIVIEQLITKRVLKNIYNQLSDLRKGNSCDIIFVDAPLLFETGADKMTDLVWLVDAELEVRIERVMKRDNVSRKQVKDRINNQMSSEDKKLKSKEIIDNSNGKEMLYKKVEDLLVKYDRKAKG